MKAKKIILLFMAATMLAGCGNKNVSAEVTDTLVENETEEKEQTIMMYEANDEEIERFQEQLEEEYASSGCGIGNPYTYEELIENAEFLTVNSSGRLESVSGADYSILAKDDLSIFTETYILKLGSEYFICLNVTDFPSSESVINDPAKVYAFTLDYYCKIYGYDKNEVTEAIEHSEFYTKCAHKSNEEREEPEALVNQLTTLSPIMAAVRIALETDYPGFTISKWINVVDDASKQRETLSVSCLGKRDDVSKYFRIDIQAPRVEIQNDTVQVVYDTSSTSEMDDAYDLIKDVVDNETTVRILTFN